jgi:hypothetical protein
MALSSEAQTLLDQLAQAPGTFIEQQQIAGPALDELIAANYAFAFGPSLHVSYMTFFRPQGPEHQYWPVGLTYDGRVAAGLPVPSKIPESFRTSGQEE